MASATRVAPWVDGRLGDATKAGETPAVAGVGSVLIGVGVPASSGAGSVPLGGGSVTEPLIRRPGAPTVACALLCVADDVDFEPDDDVL